MPSPAGNSSAASLPVEGRKAALRVLGIEPRLDGMAVDAHVGLRERQRLARRDAELQLDQVEPGDRLGHRMLDLQPRVHLHEPEAVRPQALARRRR